MDSKTWMQSTESCGHPGMEWMEQMERDLKGQRECVQYAGSGREWKQGPEVDRPCSSREQKETGVKREKVIRVKA